MKALVLERNAELSLREVSDPQRPGPRWVLLRVAYCGVCNSDIHRGFGGGAYRYPLIMGHEFSATVIESCSGCRFAAGDRVTVFPLIACRQCPACRAGELAQCSDYDYLGSRRDGAFAQLVWAPEDNLFRVPDGVSMLHAALTEPCAVARHAVWRLAPKPGATAAVFGAGPIGLMAAQWLRVRGAGEIFAVDVDAGKLDLARRMGFTPIDGRAADPVAAIRERTGGAGAERTIEAVGLPSTYRQSLAAACRAGEVVFLGNLHGELALGEAEVSSLLRRELTIRGTWNSRIVPVEANDWTESLAHLGAAEAAVDVGSLVSHVAPLAEGPELLRRIFERRGSFGKVVLQP